MTNLNSTTLKALRGLLDRCGQFGNEQWLRALFVDSRIAHWQKDLPAATSPAAHRDQLIAFLLQRANNQGQNALVLFLQTLSEQFEDNCRPQLTAIAGQIEQELRPATGPQPLNPFFFAGRINRPNQFFGRQRLLREIQQELCKRASLSLVGPSEVGKSSLLYYLYVTRADWLPDGQIVYLDLQGVLDEADFCEMVLTALGEKGDSLRQLKRVLLGRDLILCLDEMERLAESDFNPRLHNLLRSLAQEPQFALCLATRRPLIELFPPHTAGGLSPFHNVFHLKEVPSFSPAEARQLLTECPAGTGLAFSPAEIEQLLADSQCHPARLQRLAYSRFAQKLAIAD